MARVSRKGRRGHDLSAMERTRMLEMSRGERGRDYVSGLDVNLMRIQEEYVPELRDPRGRFRLYDRMANDAKIAAQLRAMTFPLISAVRWRAEGGPEEARSLVAANLLRQGPRELWCETSWLQRLNEMMRSLKYGLSVFGKTWDQVDGFRIYRALTYLSPRSLGGPLGPWEWDRTGTRIVAVHRRFRRPDQSVEVDERLPIEDVFLVVWDPAGENWEGTSLLRSMYRAWTEKDLLSKIGMIDAQNRGVGIPDVELSEKDGKEDQRVLTEIARSLRGGSKERAFIVRSPGQKVGFLTSQGGVVDTAAMIQQRNNELASAAITDFLQQGQTQSGSRASSSVLMVPYMQELEAAKNLIQDQVNHGAGYLPGLVEEVVDQNYEIGPDEEYPRITGSCVSPTEQLDNVPNILEAIQKGGLTHDLAVENHVRKALGVSELGPQEFERLMSLGRPAPRIGGRPGEVGDFDREEPRDDRDARRFGLQEKKTPDGGRPQPKSAPCWPWLISTPS